MYKILLLCSALFIAFISEAQKSKIAVSETSETIEKITRTGQSTIIELDEKRVTKAWEKQLKSYGKVESSKGVYTIAVANIPSISSSPCKIISIVKSSGKGTMVWWAIDLGNSFVTASSNMNAYKGSEKILKEFALTCYREDINDQIQDAEKALDGSVKQQEKEIKEGENLVKDVENNKQEKAKLEQELKDNAAELVQLNKDIDQNKVDQQKAAQEVEKMKKALEVVKLKLTDLEK